MSRWIVIAAVAMCLCLATVSATMGQDGPANGSPAATEEPAALKQAAPATRKSVLPQLLVAAFVGIGIIWTVMRIGYDRLMAWFFQSGLVGFWQGLLMALVLTAGCLYATSEIAKEAGPLLSPNALFVQVFGTLASLLVFVAVLGRFVGYFGEGQIGLVGAMKLLLFMAVILAGFLAILALASITVPGL